MTDGIFNPQKSQLLLWKTDKSERSLRVMDEMKISSKFTRMLLSKLAKGVLHKKRRRRILTKQDL